MAFDLPRFARLAFGQERLPDHPLRSKEDAAAGITELASEPAESALAQITYYVKSMNDTHSFSPGRRAVVLLQLHEAARPRWRALAARYLKYRGVPAEHREGDPNILRALYDSASEFATGFGLSVEEGMSGSKWVRQNLAPLCARKAHWLGKRLVLAHMLRLPVTPAVWQALHSLYRFAEEHDAGRQPAALYEKSRFPSSVRQELARAALLELAGPQSLGTRDIELAYRIAGRVARMVRLEREPGAGRHALPPGGEAPLYLDTQNGVAGLEAERPDPVDATAGDPAYRGEFTARERAAMIEHLLLHWGATPPRRRGKRISLSAAAEVLYTFDAIARALPAAEQAAPGAAGSMLSILDQTGKLQRMAKTRPAAAFPARVTDASTGGLGLVVQGSPAWLRHGALVAVRLEGGPEWTLATVRRIFAPAEKERRVGLQILSAHPRRFSFEGSDLNAVWEEAARQEVRSSETSRHGILLQPEGFARPRGEILLPAGAASRNKRLEVRSRGAVRRIQLTRLDDEGAQYDRARYELLPANVAA